MQPWQREGAGESRRVGVWLAGGALNSVSARARHAAIVWQRAARRHGWRALGWWGFARRQAEEGGSDSIAMLPLRRGCPLARLRPPALAPSGAPLRRVVDFAAAMIHPDCAAMPRVAILMRALVAPSRIATAIRPRATSAGAGCTAGGIASPRLPAPSPDIAARLGLICASSSLHSTSSAPMDAALCCHLLPSTAISCHIRSSAASHLCPSPCLPDRLDRAQTRR